MAILKDTIITGDLNVTGSSTTIPKYLLYAASTTTASNHTDMDNSGIITNRNTNLSFNRLIIARDGGTIFMRGLIRLPAGTASSTTNVSLFTTSTIPAFGYPIPCQNTNYIPINDKCLYLASDGLLTLRLTSTTSSAIDVTFGTTFILDPASA